MEIIWSQKAGDTLQRNIDFLTANWGQSEVDRFISSVFEYLETLSDEPFIARPCGWFPFKGKKMYYCIQFILWGIFND